MFAFPDMLHLLAHEFSGLRACGFALTLIESGSFHCFPFWHI
jgi:hypothetical protein